VQDEAKEVLSRLRSALDQAGLEQAVLSHPETLANLGLFDDPAEDWPVATPFAPIRSVFVVGAAGAVLVTADFHQPSARGNGVHYASYRAYSYEERLDFPSEIRTSLTRAGRTAGLVPGRVGIEGVHLPWIIFAWLDAAGCTPVACDELVHASRKIKLPSELAAIGRASRLADVVQRTVKDNAESGISEVELAGLAMAAVYREAGKRVPAIVTVTAGSEGTATGGGLATQRTLAAGELVLVDTSPWIDGAWSDSANAVYVGTPDTVTVRRFDAVRRALHLGIDACRPGAVARDIDRLLRDALADHGPTYPHHSGHGIGAAWSEDPMITPYSDAVLDEGMVLALEPALYIAGWGGIRLEHVFRIGSDSNEILTRFEHTL